MFEGVIHQKYNSRANQIVLVLYLAEDPCKTPLFDEIYLVSSATKTETWVPDLLNSTPQHKVIYEQKPTSLTDTNNKTNIY